MLRESVLNETSESKDGLMYARATRNNGVFVVRMFDSSVETEVKETDYMDIRHARLKFAKYKAYIEKYDAIKACKAIPEAV